LKIAYYFITNIRRILLVLKNYALMLRKIFSLLLIVILLGCSAKTPDSKNAFESSNQSNVKTKNVILLIGDGMGLSQITAGMYANGNSIELERFKTIGLIKVHASNNLITDSAAGATAFATGTKTYNGAVGVNPEKGILPNIVEIAEQNGLATGLVASSSITHATPASFIAHQPKRSMMEEIANDFLKTEIDLFIGGGQKHFESRKDKRNILKELEKKGYQVGSFMETELSAMNIQSDKNLAYFTAAGQPLTVEQDRVYLPFASDFAINFLKSHSDKGFFLMVEASQIDWGGHNNDSEYIINEMLDFNEVIGKVMDFAEKDGNTLVIVTADHETGGYSLNYGSTMDKFVPGFTTDYHTATMMPVFAYGPGSDIFSGIYENTEIFNKMLTAYGFVLN